MGDAVKEELTEITRIPPTEIDVEGATSSQMWEIYSGYNRLKEEGIRQGEKVLVLGSGENTVFWRGRGATTLDINQSFNPNIVGDVRNLSGNPEVKENGPYDVLIAERLTLGEGEKEVPFAVMVREAREVLRKGGEIFVYTAVVDVGEKDPNITLPLPNDALETMRNSGFIDVTYFRGELLTETKGIRRVGDETIIKDFSSEAEALYHGIKA